MSSSRKLCRIDAFNSSKYPDEDSTKPSADDQPKKTKKRVSFALSAEIVYHGFDDGKKFIVENQDLHKSFDCEVKKGIQVVKIRMTKKEAALFISKCREEGVMNFQETVVRS